MSQNHDPHFSRGSETKELRQECPLHILNTLDAISMARDLTRTALVNEILGKWAEQVHREHSLLQRVVGINPARSESVGGGA